MSEIEKLDQDVREIRESVVALREEVSASTPISEIAKYLLYFWAAISVVLGAFGWSQFSDLERTVADQVKLQLPRDKAKYAEYEKLIEDTKSLREDYEELSKSYYEKVDGLKLANVLSDDFDIQGQILVLQQEVESRRRREPNMTLPSPKNVEGTLFELGWRTKAIRTITVFKNSLAERNYPADFIFNVAQLCRALQLFDLSESLTKVAYEKNPSPPIEALFLVSKVANSTGEERESAFADIMKLVRHLPQNSPKIVLAEAWNAAEDQRRYNDLIKALEYLIEERGSSLVNPIPSYTYALLAQSILRSGMPGAYEKAKVQVDIARDKFLSEGTYSTWAPSTRDLIRTVENILLVEPLPQPGAEESEKVPAELLELLNELDMEGEPVE